jgi:hypothetical protein
VAGKVVIVLSAEGQLIALLDKATTDGDALEEGLLRGSFLQGVEKTSAEP